MVTNVLVRRDDIAVAIIRERDAPSLAPGAVRLRVESFAVTANNVTYAAFGEAMRYWDFFPAEDGCGIVPVWGHARVEASNHPDIMVGERIYGYLPMATHLDVVPERISAGSFVDAAPHRAHLAAVYNQYRRLAGDVSHDPAREGERMVFEPLFMTSFLIEAMFARAQWHGADRLVMTSASSKTALALAHIARAKSPEVGRVGLTSAGNVAFVRATGLYDLVLAYEDIATLPPGRAVCVDFAGNGAVLRAVHEALGESLAYSCLVGATHWDGRSGAGEMPGPEPILFFAPDHIAETIEQLGPKGFGEAVAVSWAGFVGLSEGLIKLAYSDGLQAAADAFVATVKGETDPAVGIVVRP